MDLKTAFFKREKEKDKLLKQYFESSDKETLKKYYRRYKQAHNDFISLCEKNPKAHESIKFPEKPQHAHNQDVQKAVA